MKVLIYFENENIISNSGIGRAKKHQMLALKFAQVDFTTNPFDDYDILHINTYFQNSALIINQAHLRNIPVIYHAHSTEEDFKNSFLFSNLISPVFKKYLVSRYKMADEIITPTIYSKNILESYGINLNINVVSNGIKLENYKYDIEKIRAFKNYFSIDKNDKVIMSVGLLFKRKGFLDFLEIAKLLPDYKFIWFGSTNTIGLDQEIKNAINNLPLNVILPGYVKGSIIQGAYQACDVFFFPSYEETEGIVVLEACASKATILLRDIDVYKPWMQNDLNCKMANSNLDFSNIIKQFINSDTTSLKQEAYKVAQGKTIEKVGLELKNIYERVLENAKK